MEKREDVNQERSSYWRPSLTSVSTVVSTPIIYQESLWRSFLRFLHFCLFIVVKRVVGLRYSPVALTKYSLTVKTKVREFLVKLLLTKRGYIFRPVSHITVLTLSFSLIFLGGAGGNIILGRGVAKSHYQVADDTVKRVIITRTEIPEGRTGEDVIRYTVKDGDTMTDLGEKFRISTESIRYANNLSDIHSLTVGQELIIPPISGVVTTVKEGDSVESLASKYKVSPQVIVDFNYLQEPYVLALGQEIVIPDADIPPPVSPTTPTSPGEISNVASAPSTGVAGSGSFTWPTDNRYITQYFSYFHPAIDIAKNSPIYAADGGTIVEVATSGWNWGYGQYVKIDHGNGYTTMYAHLSAVYVSVGEVVGRGQNIAMMGNTGRSFGTHLHFVVQYNGGYINPLSVL